MNQPAENLSENPPKNPPKNPSSESNRPSSNSESDQRLIDPRDLVYQGGPALDPREVVENPAVAPEMLEQAPEDLRDDLMPKNRDEP